MVIAGELSTPKPHRGAPHAECFVFLLLAGELPHHGAANTLNEWVSRYCAGAALDEERLRRWIRIWAQSELAVWRKGSSGWGAAVIAQIKDQGRDDDLKATIIARRAGVHRSFVSNHFADQITHAKTEIQARFVAGLSGQTALTAASLRVEMETAKQQARAGQQEIHRLKERLARTLGDEVAATHPEHSISSNAVNDLHAHVERLLASEIDLRRQLRDTDEELNAARALNRTLIRERNSNTPETPA